MTGKVCLFLCFTKKLVMTLHSGNSIITNFDNLRVSITDRTKTVPLILM